MFENPLVTVLIPVYNRPSVVKTIDSIIHQTYSNLEILIIDNASTDDTVEVIRNINDKRIRLVINETNLGQTGSMNKGLKLASGKYIARIDSDDIALPERIEEQVRFMEEHPDYVLVGAWIQYISDDDQLGGVMRMCTTDKGLRFMQTFFCGIHHPTAMYRTDVIRENSIEYEPGISMAEDYEMWRKLLHFGKGLNIGKVLVYYRRGENNDSLKHYDQMVKESLLVRKRVCAELELNTRDREKLDKALALLDIRNKSLSQIIYYFRTMFGLFHRKISKSDQDYGILRRYVFQMSFGTCFFENQRFYAKVLNFAYKQLRKTMH